MKGPDVATPPVANAGRRMVESGTRPNSDSPIRTQHPLLIGAVEGNQTRGVNTIERGRWDKRPWRAIMRLAVELRGC